MATKNDCPYPITIDGIEFTADLIRALANVEDDLYRDLHIFSESIMVLAATAIEDLGVDQRFFCIASWLYAVMKALDTRKENPMEYKNS